MNYGCYDHPYEVAIAQCNECGRYLCRYCFDQGSNGICHSCLISMYQQDLALRKKRAKKDVMYFIIFAIFGAIVGVGEFARYTPQETDVPIIGEFTMLVLMPYMFGAVATGFRNIARWIKDRIGTVGVVLIFVFLSLLIWMAGCMVGIFGTPVILHRARKALKEKYPRRTSPRATTLL